MRLQSPTREGCWLQSSSVHLDDDDQEDAWSHKSYGGTLYQPTVKPLPQYPIGLVL